MCEVESALGFSWTTVVRNTWILKEHQQHTDTADNRLGPLTTYKDGNYPKQEEHCIKSHSSSKLVPLNLLVNDKYYIPQSFIVANQQEYHQWHYDIWYTIHID